MVSTGQMIAKKYILNEELSHKGFTSVFSAVDVQSEERVIVRVYSADDTDEERVLRLQSLQAEAELLMRLDHSMVLYIHDVIRTPEELIVVQECVNGQTLEEIQAEKGTLSQDFVINLAIQLCEVLEYLHTRLPSIVHRDIRPSTILLQSDGRVKLFDFGIAREYDWNKDADTIPLGTKGYAAPEQFGGRGQTDERTDIYGLGITLHHLLTGQDPSKPPYEILPIRQWNEKLDPGLEAIISKCIQLNPEERYKNCSELQYALMHYSENGKEYRRKQKRRLRVFWLMPIMAVLFSGMGVIGHVLRLKAETTDLDPNLQGGGDEALWRMIEIIGFSATSIALILALILFLVWKIPHVIGYLSGKSAEKAIAEMRDASVKKADAPPKNDESAGIVMDRLINPSVMSYAHMNMRLDDPDEERIKEDFKLMERSVRDGLAKMNVSEMDPADRNRYDMDYGVDPSADLQNTDLRAGGEEPVPVDSEGETTVLATKPEETTGVLCSEAQDAPNVPSDNTFRIVRKIVLIHSDEVVDERSRTR